MLLCSGCPFLAPAWTPTVNTPPRIVEPDTSQDLVLVMEFEWNQVTAFARDPDGDVLNFDWVGPLGAEIETLDGGDGALQYSTFRIRRDPELDGTRVTLAVDDGEDARFAEWTLAMPGGK